MKDLNILKNLIVEMTLQGAPNEEINRVIEYTRSVIALHQAEILRIKAEQDNCIQEYMTKYFVYPETKENGTV